MSLAEALEQAASALPDDADAIRPANGDAVRLLELLDAVAAERILAWLLGNDAEAAAELAGAWAEEPDGLGPIVAIDEASLPKAGRKVLRRVRHRLRSRGVELPESAPRSAPTSRLPRIEDEFVAARVSGVDPRGSSLAYWVEPHPGGGARLFEALVDEVRGIVEFEVYTAGRSRVRSFLKDVARRSRFPAVDADPDAVRALVSRIAERHPADRPLPRAFGEWRSRLAAANRDAPTPGEQARAALEVEVTPARLREAAELVKKSEIGPWPPAAEQLATAVRAVREQAESTIVVSDAQRRERIDAALLAAADELYGGELAERTAARLEHCAYVMWRSDRADGARACLAGAAAFRSGAEENPLARALVEAALAPLLEELSDADDASEADGGGDASLLVKP